MTPYAEPLKGERTGVTTEVLISREGPIVARGHSASYQFVQMESGRVYESTDTLGAWFPWSRRPCNSVERLVRRMGLTWERAA